VCDVRHATRHLWKILTSTICESDRTAARINMSHGSHETASNIIDTVRKVAKLRGRLCPIILDTKGPEIRVSWISDIDEKTTTDSMVLESGERVMLLTGSYSTTKSPNSFEHKAVAVSYPLLANSVRDGDVVLLDDGRISLIVMKVYSEDIVYAQVIEGGQLVKNKGVNLPGW